MDSTNNKRKAPVSPSPPSTPCQALPPNGARFFPPAFGSPQTMPKRAAVTSTDNPNSPSPHNPAPDTPSAARQQPADVGDEDMDMSDSHDEKEGIYGSMHTPAQPSLAISPTPMTALPTTPAITSPPTKKSPTRADLFKSLASAAESTMSMVTISSSTLSETRHTHLTQEDFPAIYRGLPGEFLQGLPSECMDAWCDVPLPKFFVRFFGYDGSNQAVQHPSLIGRFKKAVEEIAQTAGDTVSTVEVAPPPPPTAATKHPLITFLAHDISQLSSNVILKQKIWSFPEITFEAIPFETETIPSLIQCVAGFTSADENSARGTIAETWNDPINKDRLINTLQMFDIEFTGKNLRPAAQEAIETMISSLTVEYIDFKDPGGIPSPRFNVFAHSPTKDMLAFANIRLLLFSSVYISLLCGVGRSVKLFSCQICHSFNHPRGLCLFPHLQGWNGPTHEPERRPPPRGWDRGRGRRGNPY